MQNLMTTEDLMREWQVSRQTIWVWRKKHGLPAIRLTKRIVRYDRAAVTEWLLQRRG